MPTPAVIGTSLDQVVLAVRAQLEAALGWPPERVLIDDPAALTYDPHGDAYLCLWPDLESADRPIFEGAGRTDTRVTDRLVVTVRTRCALDDAPSRASWLTDPALGHLPIRHQVYQALVDFLPTDGQGNALAVAPLVPASGGRPRLDRDQKEWGESSLSFDATYQLALPVPPA